MKKFMSVLLALLLVIMVAGEEVLPQVASASTAGVQVSLSAPAEVLPGSNFTATVNISQVVDLNGAQYEIVFDPLVLALDNVTAGQIDSTVMPVQGFALVNSGRHLVLQARLEPPYTVNGTGYLALLHFHVVGSPGDNSTINLANGILSGWGAEIPATWIGDSVLVSGEVVQLVSIAVTPTNPVIVLGQTQQFTATGTYADNNTANITSAVTWASSNTTVATISAAGLATSKAEGTTTITATSGNVSGSAILTVTAAELVSIAVIPAPASIVLGQTQQFTATGTYADNNTANITSAVTWASSNTTVATISTSGLVTSVAVGTTVITASLNGITSPGVTLTVTAGAIDHIVVSPATATITADGSQSYTVAAFNAYGGSWDVTTETTFTITAGAGGSWTGPYNNVYTAQKAGTWTVTATHTASGKTDTATLTVGVGPIASIAIAPKTASITTDQTKTYTVAAFDAYNNSWDVTAGTTFSINATAGGSWTANVYSAQKVGTWTVTATHTASGKTDTATLTVTVGALDHIVISPKTQTITAGSSQAYTVEAYDQRHNLLGDVTTNTTFAITAAAGGSWTANVYTAAKAGTWTVTGSYGGKTYPAILTVTTGAVEHIVLSPATATITAGGSQTYTVAAFDAYNNSWDVTAGTTFSINAGAGGSWTANVYTAQNAGTWTVTATHTASGKTATASLMVTKATTVEVNSGNTITIGSGGSQSNIPIDIKNFPVLNGATNGLGAFGFTLTWDNTIINVTSVTMASAPPGYTFIPGVIEAGTYSFGGFSTVSPYVSGNLTVAYLTISAVGSAGQSTSINVTIDELTDALAGAPITAVPVNAPVTIVNLLAETSISQALDASGVVVVKVNINRIKDPTTGLTANITGGIGSYTATVSSAPGSGIRVLAVRGVSPFANLTFDNVTGVFSADNLTSLLQADNTTVAELVLRLSGNATTSYNLTVAFQSIGAAGEPGLHVSEEHSNTMTFQRGDANKDGKITMTDAMFAAQFYVKARTLATLNALNAASARYDSTNGAGDKVSMTDAMFIAQYYVKVRDAYFNQK